MRIYYINCHESTQGWGAEHFMAQAFEELGHDLHQLDYRRHRQELLQCFIQAPKCDFLFMQRGDFFPLPLLQATRIPKLFWDTEHETKAQDHEHLYRSPVFDHVFMYTHKIINFYTQRNPLDKTQCSILGGSFSPKLYRPIDGIQKDIDLLYIGSVTPRRQDLFDQLKHHFPGLVVTNAFGEETARLWNRAKIALNVHAIDSLTTETRVYEVTGCRTFLLTETLSPENPYPDDALVQYSSLEDLIDKARYYLEHEEERNRIASRGYEVAIQNHTWKHRAQQIVTVAEKILTTYPKSDVMFDASRLQPLSPQPAKSSTIQVTSEAMNIGIVTTWFERGAAYVSKQMREALKKKHNVFVFARGGEMTGEGNPVWDDPSVTWTKKSPLPIPTSFDLNEFRQWIAQRKLHTVIFNEQHWWPPVIGCAQLGLKIGSYVDYYTEQTVPMFNCFDFLICNTKRHHSVFEWHPQAAYIPWGTDIDLFYPKTYSLVNPNRLTFFHSAGFNPHRKGTDWALQAFAALQGPAHLIVHAQVSLRMYFPHLSPLIDRLEQEGRLTVLEKMETAPGFYHLGDVYVYPSRLDGIGLTMAEAMACGLPLIVPDNGPMNEFHDEQSGSLVKITRLFARHDGYYWPQNLIDVNHLREIMQSYVDQRDRIEEKKRAARQFAETNLNWFENAKDLPDMVKKFTVRPVKEKEETFKMIQAFEQRRK